MVAIAQAGLLGFAPQYAKGSTPSNWGYHKSMDIDLAALDDQRIGPPEIGGRPLPTIPYKGGIMAGGGFTINPRLEGSLGWLIYGAMGYKDAAVSAINTSLLIPTTQITSGSSGTFSAAPTTTLVNSGTGAKVSVRIICVDGSGYTPTVTVTGTNVSDGAQTETYNFSTGPTSGSAPQRAVGIKTYEIIVGGKTFKTVTDVSMAKNSATTNAYLEVGYEDPVGKSHVFGLNASAPGTVPWMAFRKYIPQGDDTSLPYGEQFTDCKILNFGLNLPNDGLVSARVDTLGRLVAWKDDPFNISTGDWAHGIPSTEDYQSIPIGTIENAGYLRIPFFSGATLPVVNASVAMTNTPLDTRQLRIYGSPYLLDVVTVSRAMTFDMTVLWENPELYKMILGNSRTATTWSAKPFTTRVDVKASSPNNMTGGLTPYSVRVEAKEVMLAIQGGIRLAGTNAVMMRITGQALDTTGTYATITLENLKADADYLWPAS